MTVSWPRRTGERCASSPRFPPSWLERAVQGRLPYALCLFLSLALYANTFGHRFALDDTIVIGIDADVARGVRGIPAIFGKDLLDSYGRRMGATGRPPATSYRPLPVATFAIEQEFIGTRERTGDGPDCWDLDGNGARDPGEDVNGDGLFNRTDCRTRGSPLRHVDNALLYGLTVCLLYHFLATVVFARRKPLALLVALLFLAHPAHVEAVANLKSRDEILAGLFTLLTLLLAHRFAAAGIWRPAALASLAFLCALLSKETAVTLLALVPLSLHLFEDRGLRAAKSARFLGGMLLALGMYAAMRIRAVGLSRPPETEILNDPYLWATPLQQWATKLAVFFKYAATLVFPHPLCSDYGYRSIPYQDFSGPGPWLGILTLAALFAAGAWAVRARHWLAFAVAVHLLPLLLVGNLLFTIPVFMAERFLFLPSVGYCLALGSLLFRLGERPGWRLFAAAISLALLLLLSAKTVSRNAVWKDDATLALTDVRTMPESVRLNGNAAWCLLDLAERPANAQQSTRLVQDAVRYGEKALSLHPRHVAAHINLGRAYARLGEHGRAREHLDAAFAIEPQHPWKAELFGELARSRFREALASAGQGEWEACVAALREAVELAPDDAKVWRALGNCANNAHDREQAEEAWERARRLESVGSSLPAATEAPAQ